MWVFTPSVYFFLRSATSVPTGDEGQSEVPRHLPTNKRLQQTQAQVDEVVDIMRTNVEKVLERDQKLSQLDDRADVLQAGASQFEASAGKLKRKFWMKNMKVRRMFCFRFAHLKCSCLQCASVTPLSLGSNKHLLVFAKVSSCIETSLLWVHLPIPYVVRQTLYFAHLDNQLYS
ncbi:hypothetical protein P879_02696 [Paragonimus westermani]|uniref:V-SNARE coiled-coil homology domain-containing protein n=1 Tax=Paragonimus westermani TaxID=34504 RepID=A0A8T0DFP7_9TREM|nr:hypothetical protein P879_02696 [Paragonimus westermani]